MFNTCLLTLIPIGTWATALALSATFLCGCSAISDRETSLTSFAPPASAMAAKRSMHRSAKPDHETACGDSDPFLPAEINKAPEQPQEPEQPQALKQPQAPEETGVGIQSRPREFPSAMDLDDADSVTPDEPIDFPADAGGVRHESEPTESRVDEVPEEVSLPSKLPWWEPPRAKGGSALPFDGG